MIIVPHILDGLLTVEAKVLEAQAAPGFPVHQTIDEYSVLFGQRVDQEAFLRASEASGIVRFNEANDYMSRMDDVTDIGFGVHFDFFSVPQRTWRIEAMSIGAPASAPLHIAAMAGNPNYVGIFHASYKLESHGAYMDEVQRLSGMGLEVQAEYQNTYGRFSYWMIEPHLPYFKPRYNRRDK